MTNQVTPVHPSQYALFRAVLKTLSTHTPRPAQGLVIPPPDTWVKTRQISEAHNISIYKARQVLLELVKHGLVIVSDGPINKSLRWYPRDNRCQDTHRDTTSPL